MSALTAGIWRRDHEA